MKTASIQTLITLAALLVATTAAQAGNVNWADDAAHLDWTDGSAWVGGTPPANDTTSDGAIFTSMTNGTAVLDGNRSVYAVDFQLGSGGGELISAPGAVLTLGAGGLSSTTQFTGTNTISVDKILFANGADPMTWSLFSKNNIDSTSTFQINSSIDLGGGSGAVTFLSRRYNQFGNNQGIVNFSGSITGTNTSSDGLIFSSATDNPPRGRDSVVGREHNTFNLTGDNSFEVNRVVFAGVTVNANSLANAGNNSAFGKSGTIVIGGPRTGSFLFALETGSALIFQNLTENGTTDRDVLLGGPSKLNSRNRILNNDPTYSVAFTSTASTRADDADYSQAIFRTLELGGSNTGRNIFGGTIVDIVNSDPGGLGTSTWLEKTGSGRWILTGDNTYSGSTDIKEGTLIINGNQGNPNSLVYATAPSSRLGGTGTVGTVGARMGHLAPGDEGIGTLTLTGHLGWQVNQYGQSGTWEFELGGGNTSDRINVAGNFEGLNDLSPTRTFDFLGSSAVGTFTLVDWGGTTTFSQWSFLPSNLAPGHRGAFSFNGSQLDFEAFDRPIQTTATGDVTPLPDPNPHPTAWTVNDPLLVGNTGTGDLTIDGTTVSSSIASIGKTATGEGTVSILDDGVWNNSGDLYVGQEGVGTVTVHGVSSRLNTKDTAIGSLAGSDGAVIVRNGAQWNNTGNLYVGKLGHGTLTITNGGRTHLGGPLIIGETGSGELTITDGKLFSTISSIGKNAGGEGTVTIFDNALWSNSGDLYIGQSGNGTLTAQGSNARLTSGGASIASMAGSTGSVTIRQGAQWSNADNLFVSKGGSGSLEVSTGGSVQTSTLFASPDDLLGDGTITTHGLVYGADLVFDSSHGSYQTLAFGNGGQLQLQLNGSGALGVGYNNSTPVSLLITDAQNITSSEGRLSVTPGSESSALVTGGGSQWTISGGLFVGEAGSASLSIADGGYIVAGWGSIGINDNGSATLGGGAVLNAGSHLIVGENAIGTLAINANGAVLSTAGVVGSAAGSTGAVTINGLNAEWNMIGNFQLGVAGAGDLDITGQGTLRAVDISLGVAASGSGTALVSGSGSQLTGSNLLVGDAGYGSLEIGNSGQVSTVSGTIGSGNGSLGIVTVDNATWTTTNSLTVGGAGQGILGVINGGQVTGQNGTLGSQMNGYGEATVHGAGSVWINANQLVIGEAGRASLDVVGGGQVESGSSVIGNDAGGMGSLSVNGSGSSFINAGSFALGQQGEGTLTITDGGRLTSASGVIGAATSGSGNATVSGAGSLWSNANQLVIGEFGQASLAIHHGGRVETGSALVGTKTNGSGSVTVDGSGSTWVNAGTLQLGEMGQGSLHLRNGGSYDGNGAVTANAQSLIEVGAGSDLSALSLSTEGELWVDGSVNSSIQLSSGASVGGDGIVYGDLTLASGARLVFATNRTLTVTGAVAMDSSFGIASLIGMDSSVANGTYTLIDGTATDFSTLGLQNWGYDNRQQINDPGDPHYKAAYLQEGSLQVVVIPEPSTMVLLLIGAIGALGVGRRKRCNQSHDAPASTE